MQCRYLFYFHISASMCTFVYILFISSTTVNTHCFITFQKNKRKSSDCTVNSLWQILCNGWPTALITISIINTCFNGHNWSYINFYILRRLKFDLFADDMNTYYENDLDNLEKTVNHALKKLDLWLCVKWVLNIGKTNVVIFHSFNKALRKLIALT